MIRVFWGYCAMSLGSQSE